MRDLLHKILFMAAILATAHLPANAQWKMPREYGGMNIAVGPSAMIYLGDLTPSRFGDFAQANAGVQAAIMAPINKNLSIRGTFITGNLDGDDDRYDDWRPKRSFAFKSTVTEVSAMVQWEFRGQQWERAENEIYTDNYKIKRYKILSPYVFAGVGYLNNKLEREMDGIDSVYFYGDRAWEKYNEEKNKVYKSGMLVMPVGIGTHVLISPSIRLFAEYTYHILFNDYLDGYATAVYSSKPDAYQSFTIGIDFRLLKHNALRKNQVCYWGL